MEQPNLADLITQLTKEVTISYSRSSGPGGQNVNKVNSKATLKWNVYESAIVPEPVLQRFIENYASRITQDGSVVLHSEEYRDQKRNEDAAIEKLAQLLISVWFPPKPRKKTRPTRSSIRKRLDKKRQASEKKSERKKIKRDW